ncbi:1700067P10Rik [Phodopus roborovskii]|uniref:1700067P10Rik protein n=1 Tax=Phodopus roborovskii TaxID=109678 RepID=A0AAV0A4X2_PHORO|nr:1700067P10Rik [Phodopus roborovskii]
MSLGKAENEFEVRKARLFKGLRWKTQPQPQGSQSAQPSHSPGNELCPSKEHTSKVCLCGCSLRTKAVLHPRPDPVQFPASRMLPSLPAERKPPVPRVMVLPTQFSHSSSKFKAEGKSQLLSWRDPVPLRQVVPMSVWPKGFINPLPKLLPEQSLSTFIHIEGVHIPRAVSPVMSLVEDATSLPPLLK